LFPPVPAAILGAVIFSIYTVIFPSWMVSYTACGTTIGKYFLNTRSILVLYTNHINF